MDERSAEYISAFLARDYARSGRCGVEQIDAGVLQAIVIRVTAISLRRSGEVAALEELRRRIVTRMQIERAMDHLGRGRDLSFEVEDLQALSWDDQLLLVDLGVVHPESLKDAPRTDEHVADLHYSWGAGLFDTADRAQEARPHLEICIDIGKGLAYQFARADLIALRGKTDALAFALRSLEEVSRLESPFESNAAELKGILERASSVIADNRETLRGFLDKDAVAAELVRLLYDCDTVAQSGNTKWASNILLRLDDSAGELELGPVQRMRLHQARVDLMMLLGRVDEAKTIAAELLVLAARTCGRSHHAWLRARAIQEQLGGGTAAAPGPDTNRSYSRFSAILDRFRGALGWRLPN